MKKGLCLLLLLATITTGSAVFAADYDGYFLPDESGCDEEVIQNDGYDIIDGYTFYVDDPISEKMITQPKMKFKVKVRLTDIFLNRRSQTMRRFLQLRDTDIHIQP